MDDTNLPLDPVISLVLAYCPSAIRPAWKWLWMLQKRINDGVARVGETVLGQMRIAWWRDRISDSENLSVQRDPMLLELAEFASRHPQLPDLACRLLDAIEARITADSAEQWTQALAEEGQVLANAFAELTDQPMEAGGIGSAFACAMAFTNETVGDEAHRVAAVDRAETALKNDLRIRVPRPLSLMRFYASRVLAAPNHRLNRVDGVKLLIHGLTGHPKY